VRVRKNRIGLVRGYFFTSSIYTVFIHANNEDDEIFFFYTANLVDYGLIFFHTQTSIIFNFALFFYQGTVKGNLSAAE